MTDMKYWRKPACHVYAASRVPTHILALSCSATHAPSGFRSREAACRVPVLPMGRFSALHPSRKPRKRGIRSKLLASRECDCTFTPAFAAQPVHVPGERRQHTRWQQAGVSVPDPSVNQGDLRVPASHPAAQHRASKRLSEGLCSPSNSGVANGSFPDL